MTHLSTGDFSILDSFNDIVIFLCNGCIGINRHFMTGVARQRHLQYTRPINCILVFLLWVVMAGVTCEGIWMPFPLLPGSLTQVKNKKVTIKMLTFLRCKLRIVTDDCLCLVADMTQHMILYFWRI
jgi:hypothetical protein